MNNQRYRTGLELLRAIAIFFIVAYHFHFSWASGGFLGVNIFFVLSGYLITSKILSLEEEQAFNLKKFWHSRTRRLLPTVYTMILMTIVWIVFSSPDLLAKLWGDIVSSVFHAINWWFIFHKLSYFDSFGTPVPLKHLWYLAVQEQFFLVWTLILMVRLRYFNRSKKFVYIIFVGALFSATLMGLIYNPDGDPSRVYYGTDTRAFELLIGSWLAFVLPMKKFSSLQMSRRRRFALNSIGIMTLTIFTWSAVFLDEFQIFIYRGGLFLFSLNTVLMIACACHPSSFISRLASFKLFRWIGTRAFGIYLWHYPIVVLSTPIHEIGNPFYLRIALQLIVTGLVAEFSYRFIEMPIRELGLRVYMKRCLSFSTLKQIRLTPPKKTITITGIVVCLVLIIGTINSVKSEKSPEKTKILLSQIEESEKQVVLNVDSHKNHIEKNVATLIGKDKKSFTEKSRVYADNELKKKPFEQGRVSSSEEKTEITTAGKNMIYADNERMNVSVEHRGEEDKKKARENATEEDGLINAMEKKEPSDHGKNIKEATKEKGEISATEKNTGSSEEKNESSDPYKDVPYEKILAIGDSIMVDIGRNLKNRYTNITVDGKVSRQMSQAVKLIPIYAEFNQADNAIIIELGTNGYIREKHIDTVLDAFSKADIFLVNTRVPRSWEKKVNKILGEKAGERDNVTLVDWHAVAIKHPEYFSKDAVHLKSTGSKVLTDLISKAMLLE